MPTYPLFNLLLELPFVIEAVQPVSGPADVRIEMGSVPKVLDDDAIRGVCYQAHPQRCLFSPNPELRFYIRDGSAVTIEALVEADESELLHFLFGPVAAIIAAQRGLFPLNASCVQTDGRTIAFAGPRDAGKSAIAAHLSLGHGYEFVADDLVWVTSRGEGCRIVGGGYPAYKLWPHAIESLSVDATTAHQIRPGLKKVYVPVQSPDVRIDHNLSRLMVICNSEDHKGIEPVAGRKKFELGLEYMLFKEVLEMELGQGDYFKRVVTMFNGLEISRLYRPFREPLSADFARWVADRI